MLYDNDEIASGYLSRVMTRCVFSCNGTSIGQNLYMSKNGRGYYPTLDVQGIIVNGWASEKSFYNYDTLGCVIGEMCGHYTQVIVSYINLI